MSNGCFWSTTNDFIARINGLAEVDTFSLVIIEIGQCDWYIIKNYRLD